MKKISFIGMGNMGYAMLQGAMEVFDRKDIIYTDINEERLTIVNDLTNVGYVSSYEECVKKSKIIVLAVKPQNMEDLLEKTNLENTKDKIFISIAPGITIDMIKEKLGNDIKVVRAMPNTPALVKEGMSAITFSDDNYSDEEKEDIFKIFNSFGKTIEIKEKQLDMIVPVSGSSPAYVYMLIEAMADAGVLFGLPRDISYKLSAQSVLGAAKLVLESNQHPGELKDAVCSPGGTTIEAVRKLEELGFRSAIIEAMNQCYDKAKSFSK